MAAYLCDEVGLDQMRGECSTDFDSFCTWSGNDGKHEKTAISWCSEMSDLDGPSESRNTARARDEKDMKNMEEHELLGIIGLTDLELVLYHLI